MEAQAGSRVPMVSCSWFGVPAQVNQVFHSSWVADLVADLFEKDRSLIFHRVTTARLYCIGQIAPTTSRRSRTRCEPQKQNDYGRGRSSLQHGNVRRR